ncbi:MAG: helix-turn-helix transcriptional regulator [Oscillospiraceae bacterium]|nr:helix-turn-helix transcriptional regulator [Oscillospiraceae bacterium]
MKKQNMDRTRLLVMGLLSGGDMYGYQMIVELERRSDGTFSMKEGTLYPVLHGMEKDGLVDAYEQAAPTGRMRKYYRLTRKGKEALKTETQEWRQYSAAVDAVLGVSLA